MGRARGRHAGDANPKFPADLQKPRLWLRQSLANAAFGFRRTHASYYYYCTLVLLSAPTAPGKEWYLTSFWGSASFLAVCFVGVLFSRVGPAAGPGPAAFGWTLINGTGVGTSDEAGRAVNWFSSGVCAFVFVCVWKQVQARSLRTDKIQTLLCQHTVQLSYLLPFTLKH